MKDESVEQVEKAKDDKADAGHKDSTMSMMEKVRKLSMAFSPTLQPQKISFKVSQ